MSDPGRRILLAIQPAVLEGALANMLSTRSDDEVVQLRRTVRKNLHGYYDAAVISDDLPDGVRAEVVILLPDTYGSGGTGTVTVGEDVYQVSIPGAERVVELIDRYVPSR